MTNNTNVMTNIIDGLSYIGKWVTSKEGVTQMRNSCAMGAAGYVAGSAARKILYKKSSARNGWYSRYIDSPFAQKGIKADDKGCLIYAIAAMAMDTVLTLDGAGVIKLPSFFDEDTIEEENEKPSEVREEIKKYAMSNTNDSGITHEENNGVIDDDEDEYI